MTILYFIRHAEHEWGSDVLAGRSDVRLTETGRAQSQEMARKIVAKGISQVQASPRARTRETAEAIAEATGLEVGIAAEVDEVDFGAWTGKSFADLASDPRWRVWNAARSTAATPAGETILKVKQRVTGHIESLRTTHPEGRIAIVTHAEIIRTVLLHYLGMPLAYYDRLDIDLTSITTLKTGESGMKLTGLNEPGMGA